MEKESGVMYSLKMIKKKILLIFRKTQQLLSDKHILKNRYHCLLSMHAE